MIKEIFEIEPIQKNSLIVFIGICFLSFLQLYIFKKEIILNQSIFVVIGLMFSISVCWTVLNLFSLSFFFSKVNSNDFEKVYYDKVIFAFGFLGICWICILTYVGYELNLTFKNFIRLSILVCLIRTLFWFILDSIPEKKEK